MFELKRRDVVKVAATGGLLAVGRHAVLAQEVGKEGLAGEWLNGGDANQPCAIFQHGRVLLVVNEKGNIGSARLTGANGFVVLDGSGWQHGLKASVVDQGKKIDWHNGSVWTRA